MSKEWFYGRVSSKGQNLACQLEAARELGIPEAQIVREKMSGKEFKSREEYLKLREMLEPSDVLYVASLDCLGRNYEGICAEWEDLTKNLGIDIVVLDMPILDTRQNKELLGTLISDIVLKLLSYVAESERERIRSRQREGIEIAKREGKYKGRKPVTVDKLEFAKWYAEVQSGGRTARFAMQQMGLKPNTWYKLCKEYETRTGRFKES